MAEAGTTAATAADSNRTAIHGHIAARIDRLPLTRVQWQLAILVEVTWGFIIVDTDGIGARLYPFVWRPNHLITVLQVLGDPSASGRPRRVAWRLHHELDRRPVRAPAGYSHVHIAWRDFPVAVRTCVRFLAPRGAVGAQHAWCRRHRRDTRRVSVRADRTQCAQPRFVGLTRQHGGGRCGCHFAGVRMDSQPLAVVRLGQCGHPDRGLAAAAVLAAT